MKTNPRYLRQTILPEVTDLGQQMISQARVLCVGVGGLGGPVSLYLASAGVGTLGLIDFDHIDITNLHRQILFSDLDQGRKKIDVAQERLQQVNPEISILTHQGPLTHLNVLELFSQYDLIIEGSDNFPTKFLANDAAHILGIPIVFAAVNRFEGQVALFWGAHGPCYRCYVPAPPKAAIGNCAQAGVLGPVVGVIGSMQATLALQFLISRSDPKHPLCPQIGELALMDFTGKWMMRNLSIPKKSDCPTCSRPPSTIELHPIDLTCSSLKKTDALGLIHLLQTSGSFANTLQLIDVREKSEWEQGHIPHALHLPLSELEKNGPPASIKKEIRIVVYCKSGLRSQKAADLFLRSGPYHIEHLAGGIDQWPGPLEKRST